MITMKNTIKSVDLPLEVAVKVFIMLNNDKVTYSAKMKTIFTTTDPENLLYPEGWYYGKECFRNKHNSTTGLYGEVSVERV